MYDSGISQWISQTLPPTSNSLATLTDVQLGTLNNNDLITYDKPSNKFINKSKPEYTIEEMKDFDSTVAKLDNDMMAWNPSKNKWEPKTITQEGINYLSL